MPNAGLAHRPVGNASHIGDASYGNQQHSVILTTGCRARRRTGRLPGAGIGHVVINLPLCFAILFAATGSHQVNAERAARDLGASEWQVLRLVAKPMQAPALLAACFLSFTFSWDEFIIAFLLTRFDVTLPVEIWSMLRSGLSPRTNAIGSLVFLVSLGMLIVLETALFGRRRSR